MRVIMYYTLARYPPMFINNINAIVLKHGGKVRLRYHLVLSTTALNLVSPTIVPTQPYAF